MSSSSLRLLRRRAPLTDDDGPTPTPSQRRLFLPVAPSFVRKLNVNDDAWSVDSLDDRRYSDVPSIRSQPRTPARGATGPLPRGSPRPPARGPPRNAPRTGASLAAPSARRAPASPPQAAPPRMPRPAPHQSARPPRRQWRFLFASRAPPAHAAPVPDDDDEAAAEGARALRWAALTTCLPSKKAYRSRRASRAAEHGTDRPRSAALLHSPDCVHVAAESSFSRMPKLKGSCAACGAASSADPLSEPHSFGGFRAKPWYQFPEGSSVSSGEWDQPAAPRSSGSSRSRPRAS